MPKTNVAVKLVNTNGNSFSIMGKVCKALRKAGHGDLVEEYQTKAMSGDRDNLLAVTMEYVEVE